MAPAHLLIGVNISSCEHQDTSVGCEIFNTLGTKNAGLGGMGGVFREMHLPGLPLPGCVAIGQSLSLSGPQFPHLFFFFLKDWSRLFPGLLLP